MLFARLLPVLPLAVSASAISLFSSSNTQGQIRLSADEPNPVPGDNPLLFCEEPSKYILQIDNVDISPNPPKAGVPLTIAASGTLNEPVGEGAYIAIQVKYGLITLIKTTIDLCEQVKNVDLECPLKKGPLVVTKDVDLPQQIPPGKYTVLADVFTADDERITCLQAQVRL
ncbi:hypothetical protein BT63DRAFT_380452 [Microthyrium microscopicum]|uniref:Phosphatidylglycerol/phosphatidylinositol transfer protein n=1 Tax=Microthyrium microscopicum TaxID=703497 RepID=A0A6A6TT21_9PEZI|nr:hypothetical protein BT63DRAFT_380452 [Microthyrium microscopicum]